MRIYEYQVSCLADDFCMEEIELSSINEERRNMKEEREKERTGLVPELKRKKDRCEIVIVETMGYTPMVETMGAEEKKKALVLVPPYQTSPSNEINSLPSALVVDSMGV